MTTSSHVAALVRVSTSKQDTDAQRLAIQRWADAFHHVVAWYDEGSVKGTKTEADRPGLARLMTDCRKGSVRTIVTVELTRLGRSMMETLARIIELRDLGVRLVSLSEGGVLDTSTPIGLAVVGLLCAFAEEERRRISRRVREKHAAIKERAEREGRPHGIGAPCLLWDPPTDLQLRGLLAEGFTPRRIARSKALLVQQRMRDVLPDGRKGDWTVGYNAVCEGSIYKRLKALGLDSHGEPVEEGKAVEKVEP